MKRKEMKAYQGNKKLKAELIRLVQEYSKRDDISQELKIKDLDYYAKRGQLSAISCTLNSLNIIVNKESPVGDTGRYETELGIPKSIAMLEYGIFHGLPVEDSKNFPLSFLSAIKVGSDLSKVAGQFLAWLLIDKQDGVLQYTREGSATHVAIINLAKLWERSTKGEVVTSEEWEQRRFAAHVAYQSAALSGDALYHANCVLHAAMYDDYAWEAAVFATDGHNDKERLYKRQAEKLIGLLRHAM